MRCSRRQEQFQSVNTALNNKKMDHESLKSIEQGHVLTFEKHSKEREVAPLILNVILT